MGPKPTWPLVGILGGVGWILTPDRQISLPDLCHPERSMIEAKRKSCEVEGPAVLDTNAYLTWKSGHS